MKIWWLGTSYTTIKQAFTSITLNVEMGTLILEVLMFLKINSFIFIKSYVSFRNYKHLLSDISVNLFS